MCLLIIDLLILIHFAGVRSIGDLQSVAVYARDRLNPYLFNYALSVAILHRPDTKELNIPLFAESFPEKFMDSKVFQRIREEATIVPVGQRMSVTIPRDYTASDLEPEHRSGSYKTIFLLHYSCLVSFFFFGFWSL